MLEILCLIAALGFAAIRLRGWLLPTWTAATARLVEIVFALTILSLLGQVLGTVGLFEEIPVVGAGIPLGIVIGLWAGGQTPKPVAEARTDWSPAGPGAVAIAVIASALVSAKWIVASRPFFEQGMWGFDGMNYHLPFAAWFAQAGSTLTPHYFQTVSHGGGSSTAFQVVGSELFHGFGMVILDRDILSPLLNFGWLGLALLAAWCIGRAYGVGPASLVAVGVLLITDSMTSRQPGNAYSDIPALALLLAAAAILVSARLARDDQQPGPQPFDRGALIAAGLAAGLAVSAKLTALAPVAVITVGLFAVTEARRRTAVAGAWLGALAATGSYWFLRNLLATGNPLPWLKLGIGPVSLPAMEQVVDPYPVPSLLDYATDTDVWTTYIFPGWGLAFGDPWWLLIGLGLAGAIGVIILSRDTVPKVLGAAVLVGLAVYVTAPASAPAPGGEPVQVGNAARWAAPMLALGLALLPTVPRLRTGALPTVTLAILGLIFVTRLDLGALFDDPWIETALLLGALAALASAALILWSRRLRAVELLAGLTAIGFLAMAAYWNQATEYLEHRYTNVWPDLSVSSSFRWANTVHDARIAVAGTTGGFLQYGYYGNDLSNKVSYIGRHDPHGAFNPIETCGEWRAELDGSYGFLVTTPTFNPDPAAMDEPGFSPEQSWTKDDPAARLILQDGPVSVYELTGPLDPDACASIRPVPFSGLPLLLPRH